MRNQWRIASILPGQWILISSMATENRIQQTHTCTCQCMEEQTHPNQNITAAITQQHSTYKPEHIHSMPFTYSITFQITDCFFELLVTSYNQPHNMHEIGMMMHIHADWVSRRRVSLVIQVMNVHHVRHNHALSAMMLMPRRLQSQSQSPVPPSVATYQSVSPSSIIANAPNIRTGTTYPVGIGSPDNSTISNGSLSPWQRVFGSI